MDIYWHVVPPLVLPIVVLASLGLVLPKSVTALVVVICDLRILSSLVHFCLALLCEDKLSHPPFPLSDCHCGLMASFFFFFFLSVL